MYGTGLSIEIPEGYVGFIFPRSSNSKMHLALCNSVGVIDSGYRGEIICKFKPMIEFIQNTGDDPALELKKYFPSYDMINIPSHEDISNYSLGDKVCQLIIMPYPQIDLQEVDQLTETERGDQGFGSSGK